MQELADQMTLHFGTPTYGPTLFLPGAESAAMGKGSFVLLPKSRKYGGRRGVEALQPAQEVSSRSSP